MEKVYFEVSLCEYFEQQSCGAIMEHKYSSRTSSFT